MVAEEIEAAVDGLGAWFVLKGDRLLVKGVGATVLSDGLRTAIREHKAELIALLSQRSWMVSVIASAPVCACGFAATQWTVFGVGYCADCWPACACPGCGEHPAADGLCHADPPPGETVCEWCAEALTGGGEDG